MQKFNEEFVEAQDIKPDCKRNFKLLQVADRAAEMKILDIADELDARIKKLENVSNAKLATMVNLLIKHCQDLDERINELERMIRQKNYEVKFST